MYQFHIEVQFKNFEKTRDRWVLRRENSPKITNSKKWQSSGQMYASASLHEVYRSSLWANASSFVASVLSPMIQDSSANEINTFRETVVKFRPIQ